MVKVIDADALRAWILANERDEVVPVATQPTPVNAPLGIPGTFVSLFRDDFNSLDTSIWGTNWLGTAGTITKPVNSYEIAACDPAQVKISNGKLQLTAISKTVVAKDGKTYNYVTGLVNSAGKKEFTTSTKGIIMEAKIFCPAVGTKIANWPAVWMNGHHTTWPDAGELDIMEGLSGQAAYHYHGGSSRGASVAKNFTGWHTFAAEWYPDRVVFWYDGVQVGTLSGGIYNKPMYMVLNNGISKENLYGGPLLIPATMEVEYVAVWTRA